jgi:sigma-B regulation protein RsbU (phosphoserine phosphatase)
VLKRDPTGAPVVVRSAVFDATDRREYERELLRAKQRAEESEAQARLLARTLQQTLIPPAPPLVSGLDIAAVYRPAGSGDEVGGDFYDIFEVAAGDWVVAVGDVCGKGVDAAVVTAAARYAIRAAAVGHPRPRDVLARLNEALLRHESDRFCTVALMRLRSSDGGATWTASVASGGHPPPLLARAGHGPVPLGRPGSLVGVFDDARFHDTDIALRRGDALVLYTDGVTEGRRDREFFGDDRLDTAVASRAPDAAALTGGILDEVLAFQSGSPRDDIVIVAIGVR